jgi:predicted XRE-type DNA-binding protein
VGHAGSLINQKSKWLCQIVLDNGKNRLYLYHPMQHPLQIWLDAQNLSQSAFAARGNFSRQTVWRVMNGECSSFSVEMLQRISRATGGAVSVAELLPLTPGDDARAAEEAGR